MNHILQADISSITVEVQRAYLHRWERGESLYHDPSTRKDSALEFHLWLMQEGQVSFFTDRKRWSVRAGEACFIPDILERRIVAESPSRWFSLRLKIAVYNEFHLMKSASLPAHWHPAKPQWQRMDAWMQQIHEVFYMKGAHHDLLISGLGHALLGLCWPQLCPEPLASVIHEELPPWLSKTLRVIDSSPACTVAGLAHDAGFSPAQFRRAFHQHTGSTPRDYLQRKRLETAVQLLEQTQLSLHDITQRIGLSDTNYFSQLFKKCYGIAPIKHRLMYLRRIERGN